LHPNLSPWSVIPNESSFGKIGHDEQGRLLETIITSKTCHIKCNVFITFYKFYATEYYMSSMNVAFSLSSLRFDIKISKRAKDEKNLEKIYKYEKRMNEILEQQRIHQATFLTNRF